MTCRRGVLPVSVACVFCFGRECAQINAILCKLLIKNEINLSCRHKSQPINCNKTHTHTCSMRYHTCECRAADKTDNWQSKSPNKSLDYVFDSPPNTSRYNEISFLDLPRLLLLLLLYALVVVVVAQETPIRYFIANVRLSDVVEPRPGSSVQPCCPICTGAVYIN